MPIVALEEYTCRTWPALETVPYDGWLLRFAEGCTKRANAVYPLYPSAFEIDRKIAHVEDEYTTRGLRPTFKMTEAVLPPALDSVLAGCGYEIYEPSLVMSMWLTDEQPSGPPADVPLTLTETFDERWIDSYFEFQPSRADQKSTYLALLGSAGRRVYATVDVDGRTVAVGMVSRSRDHAGIYNMATHPDYRGRGYAEAVVRALLEWSRRQGARTAFLSVLGTNETAQRVYRRCGFSEAYRYWYRVKQTKEGTT